jgi:hypothetical protein
MKMHDLFTPESVAAYQSQLEAAATPARELFAEYVRDREEQLKSSQTLTDWINALEEGTLTAAADPALWSGLIRDGFITCPPANAPNPDHGTFSFRVISPKVMDAFRDRAEPRSDYAFTEVRVCARRDRGVPPTISVPKGWENAALVDTELFELPPDVTPDNMDDREKIHLVYLAATHEGRFVFKPLYIGVGTGEAYGVGTRRRRTHGRFRFYRYDIKDDFHLEYIRRTDGEEIATEDASQAPAIMSIDDDRATILLGRGGADGGFMCLSDPSVAEWHGEWLRENPHNQVVYQQVLLEKFRDDLRTGKPTAPFRADDVDAVLEYAWQTHRLFFAAWHHPCRLSEKEGLDLYFKELPASRRATYEIYRFRPELFGMSRGEQGHTLTIPRVLWSKDLRAELEKAAPAAVEKLEKWLWQEAIKDLYAYGNHPELRLCTAIALWRRLSDSAQWSAMLKATFHEELYGVTFSPESMIL